MAATVRVAPVEFTIVRRERYVPALDGVRGLAILGVLALHTTPRFAGEGPLAQAASWIQRSGVFGVDLFFVLSGFLITGILLDTKGDSNYLKNFYARRFLRLFPVYYGYLLALVTAVPLVHYVLRSSMPDYKGPLWWYLTYLANWKPGSANDAYLGQFWSLAVEEQFYLVWPAVVYFSSRKRLAWICAACAALSVTARWLPLGLDVYRVTIMRLDALGLGALAALAFRDFYWRNVVHRYKSWIVAGAVAAFAAVTNFSAGQAWTPANAFPAAVLSAVFVFHAATIRRGWLTAVLSWQPLRQYGKYSYCIYVIHLLVLAHAEYVFGALFGRWRGIPGVAVFLISAITVNAAIYAIAALSWRLYESPILKLKDRFA